MVYKVLVVDDSRFFQVRLKEMINAHPELTVVGVASNGSEGISLAKKLSPDIITMDYEMPYLDGISAVREIMATNPTPIVMFSSMTFEGAKITIMALEAGAVDFITKDFSEISIDSASLKETLHNKLLLFVKNKPKKMVFGGACSDRSSSLATSPSENLKAKPLINFKVDQSKDKPLSIKNKIKLVVIGTSTGGPSALTEVLSRLPESYSLPIVVIQHMPKMFTAALAERLDKLNALNVKEAQDGDKLEPGKVLIAPGESQLIFDRSGHVKIIPGDDRVMYKPSVDVTFASAANVYGSGVLGVVMTGMGSDGCDGARLIKEKGGYIWGQDEASCIIYGMPRVIANAGLVDFVVPLTDIGPKLVRDI